MLEPIAATEFVKVIAHSMKIIWDVLTLLLKTVPVALKIVELVQQFAVMANVNLEKVVTIALKTVEGVHHDVSQIMGNHVASVAEAK